MKLEPRNKAVEVMENFCAAYEKRDLNYALSLFTKNSTVWGSGIDEYRVGLKGVEEQLKRDWGQSDQGKIVIKSFVTSPKNELWVSCVCTAKITIDGTEHSFEHLRGTIILEEENGAMKIAHMHASFPDFRNAEGGSFPEV